MADRRVELDYVFDRLGDTQLVQAYRLLVPQRRWQTRGDGDDGEHGGDLRASVFGSTETAADHSQSDSGVAHSRGADGVGDTGAVGVRR